MAQKLSQQIHLTLEDGRVLSVERGTSLENVAELSRRKEDSPAMLGYVGGKLRELTYRPDRDVEVRFLTLESLDGYRTYVRTLYFMLVHVIQTLYGSEAKVRIKHSVHGGTYFQVFMHGNPGITDEEAEEIRSALKELVRRDVRITKDKVPLEEALEYFESHGMEDKVRMFRYRRFSVVNIYSLGATRDYFYGYMLPRTGMVNAFDLMPYKEGLVLRLLVVMVFII